LDRLRLVELGKRPLCPKRTFCCCAKTPVALAFSGVRCRRRSAVLLASPSRAQFLAEAPKFRTSSFELTLGFGDGQLSLVCGGSANGFDLRGERTLANLNLLGQPGRLGLASFCSFPSLGRCGHACLGLAQQLRESKLLRRNA
jgi:hypothetical protein